MNTSIISKLGTLTFAILLATNLCGMEADRGKKRKRDYKKPYPELHRTAQSGDMDQVRSILAIDPSSVHSRTSDRLFTALHLAAKFGYRDIAQLLIEHKANVNSRDKEGMTPLHEATRHHQYDIAQLLLDNGADIDAQTYLDFTPLHYATYKGNDKLIQLFIEKGASLDIKTKRKGKAPLDYAQSVEVKSLIRAALAKKRDAKSSPPVLSKKHAISYLLNPVSPTTSPLDLDDETEDDPSMDTNLCGMEVEAGKRKRDETQEQEREMRRIHPQNRIDAQLLLGLNMTACGTQTETDNGSLAEKTQQFFDKMIESGKRKDHTSQNAIYEAVECGLIECVHALLSKTTQLFTTYNERSALHIAAQKGTQNTATQLLQLGAPTEATAKENLTPLHCAAISNNTAVAQVLLTNNANVDAQTRRLVTPLHYAAEKGFVDMAQLLVDQGANIDAETEGGLTPIDKAKQNKRKAMIRFLTEANKKKSKKKLSMPFLLSPTPVSTSRQNPAL